MDPQQACARPGPALRSTHSPTATVVLLLGLQEEAACLLEQDVGAWTCAPQRVRGGPSQGSSC